MLIDTHAHLMFAEFDEGREEVLARAREAGLKLIINVGCGAQSSEQSVKMAQEDSSGFLYATVGLHPYDADQVSEELIGKWENWILEDQKTALENSSHRKIVAIGETGLDYFKSKIDHEKQKESFRKHLELAVKVGLPVIVHNRQADEDCLGILKEFQNKVFISEDVSAHKQQVVPGDHLQKSPIRAVFHCYGSTLEFARRIWEAGFMTSFTGIITFPSAKELREVVKELPLDRFMIETDSPYLAPQAYRGKRNEPAYVVEVAKMIAEVKGMSFEEVSRLATANTVKFFGLS